MVGRTGDLPRGAKLGVQRDALFEPGPGRPDAEVRIVGDLQRPPSRPLEEATLGPFRVFHEAGRMPTAERPRLLLARLEVTSVEGSQNPVEVRSKTHSH